MDMPIRRAASEARKSSVAIVTPRSLIESKFTAHDRHLDLHLNQDGQVISVDENVSSILEGGQQFERLLEVEEHLAWRRRIVHGMAPYKSAVSTRAHASTEPCASGVEWARTNYDPLRGCRCTSKGAHGCP